MGSLRLLLVAVAVAVGAFAGTASADPGAGATPGGCVGANVSDAAHVASSDDTVKGGLGAQAHAVGANLGQAIQDGATAACGKH